MNTSKKWNDTHIASVRFPGLVNRKRVIATAEDKANLTGYTWTRPHSISKGFIERRSKDGTFLYFSLTLPITITDVDGRAKKTIQTSFFEQDKATPQKQPAVGVWVDGLAGKYHGGNSRNWKQEHLTLSEIMDVLNSGYAFAPGRFDPPENKSFRSGDYCQHRQIILYDGDEWTDAHPAPADLDAFLLRYPNAENDFYWIGESINSRTQRKPELRTRLMQVLPEPIHKGQDELWETVIDETVEKYPFIARGVGIDKVRLSFGNARPESENRVLGGITSQETFAEWNRIASDKRTENEANRLEAEQAKADRKANREKKSALTAELKKRGHILDTYKDPIYEFCEVNPARLIVELGLGTHLSGNSWNWTDASPGRSFELNDTPHGININPFSNTMQSASPEVNGTNPVNAHRFMLFYLHKLDITQDTDKPELRRILADMGYGMHPDDYKQAREKERLAAIQERLLPSDTTQTKLQHNRESDTTPTETLDANRANRETASDTFFEADTESLHVLLVKDATGTGKTHTLFAKARLHDKRPLAQLPHTDLAKQAVDIAFQHGFTNPFHLLGREHNWDDSGIAEIPVADRTADLFEKNNCLMCDQVRTYTEKRLAPRSYCEHKCPFLERDADGKIINICPHLAQYQDLGDRDFIASCAPNLLFDLNFRGYLKSLVTDTDEPSDEELAIDAMLGTESKGTTPFNLAILDDYGISGLYADVSLFQSEFKRLKKAWHGTPTADFAKGLLKAFEKKKPHKIVKLLRNAFDCTLDFHTDISENLTQHARIGIVEWVDKPKASKESKRMLTEKQVRYEDGGKQFIPVDFDAHKELSEKGIPSVNCHYLDTEDIGATVRIPHSPVHALMAGVTLEELTPLWQKGATPIELIGIFLESLGNDTNAPIGRTFRTGDPPEPVLTFSIPPQAPIGILPHIAMLSAPTDIEATKAAFDGQPVTFSEHTGGRLEWADGVEVYQYADARLTGGSVFDYPQTADGRRQLQETPIGLQQTAAKRLAKLNDWAKATDGLTAFISYKDFTETFGEAVEGFDIVSHFDKVAGLNFDGLKFLVVFGYPKVKHDVVMSHARKQYASDSEPLPKADPTLTDDNGKPVSEYMQLTQDTASVENGISIIERRFRDPRLEKIRHQLATEKLEQAIGRSRLPLWTDTITLIFTDAPIANISDRATLFSSDAFNLAEKPSGLLDAMQRIQDALDKGEVKEVMETSGKSQRQSYEITKDKRKQKKGDRDDEVFRRYDSGETQKTIAKGVGIGLATVNRILNTRNF